MPINFAEATGEMSLIISLTLAVSRNTGKGRLKNLLNKLQKLCEKEFKRFPPMYGKVTEINNKIVSFSENCGWDDTVETIIFVSFLLGLIEQSEYKYPQSIIEVLNDIYEFITNGRDYHGSSRLADHALLIWAQYDKIKY